MAARPARRDGSTAANAVFARTPVVAAGVCGLAGLASLAPAFHGAALRESGHALAWLGAWVLAAVFGLACASFAVQAARWSAFVPAGGRGVSWSALLRYRLAGWGVNYVTPGVQVGGEVLRVAALERVHGVARGGAITSVLLDKLVEVTTSVTVLVLGLAANGGLRFLRAGRIGPAVFLWAAALVATAATVVAVASGRRPFSRGVAFVLRALPRPRPPRRAGPSRILRTVARSETCVAAVLGRSPGIAVRALVASVVYWALLLGEYALICASLGARLTLLQVLAALAVTHVAVQLTPLPGGLGTLEASHVAVFASFGVAPATALLVALVVRGRDVLFAALGLALAARGLLYRAVRAGGA
ncbi:MAG TPA: lysylphosphatidylglycerol synthase transmembrane domain-containing protein [Thermoanaerobaculaceae bacterium]|nr:lysylphosphatidylglycerol synthase transmembrane domain-containing protein [Thermoanaerobaculaceae bacterium]